jgi:hypothetical protein
MDHLWLNKTGVQHLVKVANARIYPNIIPVTPETDDTARRDTPKNHNVIQGIIVTRHDPVVYNHTGREPYFSTSTTIPFKTGLRSNQMKTIMDEAASTKTHSNETYIKPDLIIGYGSQAHVRLNVITNAYSSYRDFLHKVHIESTSTSSRSWERRWINPVAFTPPCDHLHPGAINYLSRLVELSKMHVFGGCLANRKIEQGQVLNDNKKARIAQQYRFAIIWDPISDVEGYASEPILKSLAYNVIPVLWGPPDIENFVPMDSSVVYMKDFINSPEKLAQHLDKVGSNEKEWKRMMAWRTSFSINVKRDFLQLWQWSLTQSVCRVCDKIAANSKRQRNQKIAGRTGGSAENSKVQPVLPSSSSRSSRHIQRLAGADDDQLYQVDIVDEVLQPELEPDDPLIEYLTRTPAKNKDGQDSTDVE